MGDIVGTPTAGCNGDIAMIELPIFSFWFTGLVVKNYDGTIHHGKGIPPTYLISPTIEGLVSHRDEVLEKAIECILK
jgi:hypothetical protein